MTPDVVVDVGNSRLKWGRVSDAAVAEVARLPLADEAAWAEAAGGWGLPTAANWCVAGSNPDAVARFADWCRGRGDTVAVIDRYDQIPVAVDVPEPSRVGLDRLLNAAAASARAGARPAAAIDIGTAVTVDFVLDGAFVGGAILPGPWLMAAALHEHTARLPKVEPLPQPPDGFCGTDTESAIRSGISAAIQGAVTELLLNWSNATEERVTVFVTGGGSEFYDDPMLDADTVSSFAVVPELTLDGIRLAAEALP